MRAALLALALAGAGCAPAPADPPLFPLNAGWRWDYVVTTERPAGVTRDRLTVENRAPMGFADQGRAGHRVTSLGNHYFFRQDERGIFRVGSRHDADSLVRLDEDDPLRFVIRQPLAAGTAWQVNTHPFLARRKLDGITELRHGRPIAMRFEIASIDETVEVPAGRFEHCVRVIGQHTLRNLADHVVGRIDIELTQREWYCPNAGLVKFEREENTGRSQLYQGGRYALELAALRR